MILIVFGIVGISFSTVFMTPVVPGKGDIRRELMQLGRKTLAFSALSGLFLVMIASTSEAVSTLIGRWVRKKVSTSVYTYVVYIASTLVLLLSAFIQGSDMLAYGSNQVIIGLLLAVFSTILGHSIFSWCLKFLPPSFVFASKLCELVAAAILAVFLFGELPGLLQILGGITIIGGVLFYSRVESGKP